MPPDPGDPALGRKGARQAGDIVVRPARSQDDDAISTIIHPVIRAGETYALAPDMTADKALAFWCADGHAVFVATDRGEALGTYFLAANKSGGGDHVANAGFITSERARGRGVARIMGLHALEQARVLGFLAMQFNFVIANNHQAVRLWRSLGFEIVGRIPKAFRHPRENLVDALIMHRFL